MRRVFLGCLLFFLAAACHAQNTYPPLIRSVNFTGLSSSANNGTILYCRDCDATDPCAGSGTGAFALRVNGAWQCAAGGGGVAGLATTGGTGIVVETAPGVTDDRDITSSDGSNVIVNPGGIAGDIDITVDSAVFSRFASGTADATGNCSPGTFFVRTDTNEAWFCTATNTWTKVVKTASTLTANLPVIGGGTSLVAVGTRSGNTTAYVTTTGSQTSGDCVSIDASGNHIASGAACGGSSAPDILDFTHTYVKDEFSLGGSTTGIIGDLGWSLTQSASAGTVAANQAAQANHPGLIALNTGVTDNGGPTIAMLTAEAGDYGSEDWEANFIIQPEDAVTDTCISVGLNAGAAPATTSAIRAIFDSDHSHATWIFQLCDSSTTGCQSAGDDTNADTVASTKVPAAGTWQRIRIRRVTAGVGGLPTIYMSVGDAGAMETEKTFCSSGCDSTAGNMPTAALGFKLAITARAATTNKDLFVDFFGVGITSTQVRY